MWLRCQKWMKSHGPVSNFSARLSVNIDRPLKHYVQFIFENSFFSDFRKTRKFSHGTSQSMTDGFIEAGKSKTNKLLEVRFSWNKVVNDI